MYVLTFMYANACTFNNKINEILLVTGQYNLDVVVVKEVKPKHSTVPTIASLFDLTEWLPDL